MSDFQPSADQTMLRDGFRDLLDGVMTEPRRRVALDGPGFSHDAWREIAAGGWLEVAAPGVGDDQATALTLALLAEEIGGHALPVPLTLALALVIPVLARAPAEAIDLAAVLTGRQIATIALPDAGIPADPAWTAMSVRAVDGSRLQIAGRLPMVLLGEVADWILVPVRRPEGGLAVAALDTSRAEVRRVPAGDLDFAKPTTEVIVDGAWIGPEHLLGAGAEDLTGLLTDWLRRYLVCVDAESVGGAAEAIHRTVTYVCERRQFGVPVGSFQAVKHIMADAYGEMESARGLARHVAWRLDHDPEPPDDDLICSRLLAGTMYPSVIERCIQCHGGAGFTWEQGLHRWYRQALFHRSHPFSRRALRDHLWQRVRAGMADTVSA